MTDARLTEIRVEGLRTLADVRLKLDGLTVLIGENGSGKSSLIEACELLRRAGGSDFLSEFYNPHGGMFSLLRDGAQHLRLGAEFQWGDHRVRYSVTLTPAGAGAVISDERLSAEPPGQGAPLEVIARGPEMATSCFAHGHRWPNIPFAVNPSRLVLSELSGGEAHVIVLAVRRALQTIEVHLPTEVLPSWAARAYGRKSEVRGSVLLQPAEHLDLFGTNLVNVYNELRQRTTREHWDTTMDFIRLGLGDTFEEVRSAVDMGGGAHALAVKWRGRDALMPASALSDGQLAYLAFVGLYRQPAERTLLAVDEPESHLHPRLLFRVVHMFDAMAETHPVLISTHSDRLLDALKRPDDVKVCELDERTRATVLRELDPSALAEWLRDFRGLGELRSHGHLSSVMKDAPGR